jgi:hypothetical protein
MTTAADLEVCQHSCGNEIGEESQAHNSRQQQHRANQCGQRGGRRDELRRVAVRYYQAGLRAGQDRQRGRGADAEHARRTEQCVYDHRDESGIQTCLNRQAGYRRIVHGLGQNDRGRRETGDHIEAQRGGAGGVRW